MLLTQSRKQQSQVVNYRKLDIYKYSIIVICLIASIWFIGFRRSSIGYIASGAFLMYIAFVWFEVSVLKFKLNVRKHIKGTIKGNTDLSDSLDKIDNMYVNQVERNGVLMDNLDWCFGVIRQLTDEVKPLKLNVTNKHNVKMTLTKAEEIKIEYEGRTEYATPTTMGMVDHRKKTNKINWGWNTLFCKYNGKLNLYIIMSDLGINYNDVKERDKIYQQLKRYRGLLGKFLGVKIDSSDYTLWKGVFTWKSIMWSDEKTGFKEKLLIEEAMGRAEGHKKARHLHKVRTGEYDFQNGESQYSQKDKDNAFSLDEIIKGKGGYNPSDTESFDADD